MDAGILPVKRLDEAKERLAEHFEEAGRMEIARALVEDALELCRRTSGFLQWWVVSEDVEVLDRATMYGFKGVKDEAETLNGAVSRGIQAAASEGANSVTVIPSDAPLTYSGDLRDVLDSGATSDVVVVPAERDGGTNALYLRPPDLMPVRFGPASLRAHVSLAERLGYRCSILVLPRLALDIDTVEDVDVFLSRDELGTSHTAQVLARLRAVEDGEP